MPKHQKAKKNSGAVKKPIKKGSVKWRSGLGTAFDAGMPRLARQAFMRTPVREEKK